VVADSSAAGDSSVEELLEELPQAARENTMAIAMRMAINFFIFIHSLKNRTEARKASSLPVI
jgi:hypothetical protein